MAAWLSSCAFTLRLELCCGVLNSREALPEKREKARSEQGQLVVHVLNGKGGKEREVPALPGHEQGLLALVAGRKPEERVFDHIPKHMDVHAYRRAYAQALYRFYAGCELPLPDGRLKHSDYDLAAVQRVSWALEHNRLDVVLRHYLC